MHVNKASGHTLADVVRGVPPETHSSEGGGVWAEYLPKAALMSNDLFLDDVNVLVPVWLGGRGDRPGFPIGRNRISREVPIHRGRSCDGLRVEELVELTRQELAGIVHDRVAESDRFVESSGF